MPTAIRNTQNSTNIATSGGKRRRRGSAYIEFSLVFILFLAILLAFFDFGFMIFARATLQHSVRAGVRYAILATSFDGMGHDDSIKSVVQKNALGLLSSEENLAKVNIEYFLPDCVGDGCSTVTNGASNIVVISVQDYSITPVGPFMRLSDPMVITVAAVDKMEPFPGQPPLRELPE
jgi:Flp pilus assembly protein TadG